MQLKSIKELKNLKGKKVLLRLAYDVPLEAKGTGWVVADIRRITETIPTIKYLLKQQCGLVILSWLDRPGGKIVEKYRMDPVAKALSKILKKPVRKLDDCIGPKVFSEIKNLKPGKILMLENSRFYPEEEKNNRRFAKLLVHGLDLVVFDAFAQSHRIHASTVGILELLPAYAGFLMVKELKALSLVCQRPKKPLVLVMGGAKITDKVAVLQQLIKIADKVLIGGGIANIFLKALSVPIGSSFVQDELINSAGWKKINSVRVAKKIYKLNKDKVILPVDFLAGNKIDGHSLIEVVNISKKEVIDRRWKFLDIGPDTISEFVSVISKAGTIFWNGPMGVFEIDKFGLGTKKIAQAISKSKAITVAGGGDTEAAVIKYKLGGKFSHLSTGGGASLVFVSGKELPVLKYLTK